MLATIVNAVVVLICAILGTFLKRGFPEKLQELVMQLLGMCTIIIGARMALTAENDIIVVVSLVIGALIGHLLKLDYHMDNLGKNIKKTVHVEDGGFVEGFVSASLIFCVGAMAIVGSIEAGLHHEYSIIFTKSTLDGVMSIVLGASLGIGVAFSAASILVYQGLLTILAGVLQPVMTDFVVGYISATGGILIIGIGLGIMGLKNVNTINALPALFIVGIVAYFMPVLGLA